VFHADPTVHYVRDEQVTERAPLPERTPQTNPLFVDTLRVQSPERVGKAQASPQSNPLFVDTLQVESPEQIGMAPVTPQSADPVFTDTYSFAMSVLTPANTASLPVELPQAPAQKPESSTPADEAAVGGVESAQSQAKYTASAHESAAELAHTGADETAALAALALALMGTGITLVGLKRRQTA
jgi:LPXTG-motif cell wall-anchored protein